MSFGGFGASNNSNTGFGGFGTSNSGGFGASNNTSSGGGLFGGNTSTSGGFGGGSTFGGNNQGSGFGASKPAFGAPPTTTSGGGMFGANTSTSGGFGGGGFGSTNNATSNTSTFGSNNTGGGLFGSQNKPATGGFGSTNSGGSLFGGSGGTTGGFGATNNTAASGGFGSGNTGGFGSTSNAGGGGGGFTFGGGTPSNAGTNSNSGTGGTPFSAVSEKDAQNTNASYQSITFQGPYINKSFEELRVEDYAQGRKFGNNNGQAGSFGQSTGFGGFGSNNNTNSGTAFGSNNNNNNTSTANTGFGGFGASNTNNTATAGGFGAAANTGGGLFGQQQNKPAGGLFGNTQTTATTTGGFGSTAGSGGGLFGSNTNNAGGFGSSNNNTNTQQTGGLFGNTSNQQAKPAFGGGFGSNNNASTSFGGNSTTGGGLFGSNNNQQSSGGGGLFGNTNNQQQTQQQNTGFGASNNTGGGLFGSQPKPAGGSLFGNSANTNTGGGLFGGQNNQQQQSGGGLFGASNNNSGGGLFGAQNQSKPASTGLFGSTSNTGGGLFGNQNNQQSNTNTFGASNNNAGSSLFGNQNKPAGSSLFGGTTTNSNTGGGGSMFGNNQQNQQTNAGGSLFGSMNQTQNNNNGSLMGGSFGQSGQQPQQNQLHASITGAPYGNEQLFSSLAAPSPPVGPLATPLNGARPAARKTPSLLASARLNTPTFSPRGSAVANRYGANGGYGFNYSTYGTPGSAFTAGSLTPGATSLLKPTGSLSSALTSRLNKSLSTSNLRGESPNEGRSLLRASAFSPDGAMGSFGSRNMRKLNIDRSLRNDLFGPQEEKNVEQTVGSSAQPQAKRVNFESPQTQRSATPEASAANALVRTEEDDEVEPASSRRARPSTRSQTPSNKAPEMEEVNGSLGTVPEDSVPARPSSAPSTQQPAEKARRTETGEYYTKPAMKDLGKMSRQQLKNVGNFVVGREGVGRIEFGSVDLTNTPLEDICGNIVQLNPRSATVYQDDANKPAMGKALNVPSTIHLENSWPRSHGGKRPVNVKSGRDYDKHIIRLKRVGGTHFQKYDAATGVWTFKVDHFTTYGLDDDDDDDESQYMDDTQMGDGSSRLSDPPDTPTGQQEARTDEADTPTGEMDDTFEFKFNQRSQRSVPGGFGSEGVSYDYDDESADEAMDDDQFMMSGGLGEAEMEDEYVVPDEAGADGGDDSFAAPGGPVQAPSPGAVERYHSSMIEEAPEDEEIEDVSQEIPGSFVEPVVPKSILKPSTGLSAFASPQKLATDTWEEQLQRTLSPKKRDRQALRDMQQSLFRAHETDPVESPFKQSMLGQSALGQSYLAQKSAKKAQTQPNSLGKSDLGKSVAFTSAKDIMDSLWAQDKPARKQAAGTKGFELPYPKKRRLSSSSDLRPNDLEWHDVMKPHFTDANGTMVYSMPATAPQVDGPLAPAMKPIVGAHKDVRFARLAAGRMVEEATLAVQKGETRIEGENGFPVAKVPRVTFASLAGAADPTTLASTRECWIWKICSIFLDPLEAAAPEFLHGVPDAQIANLDDQMRMDALAAFWAKEVVVEEAQASLKRATSPEEKALILLTSGDIVGACDVLASARDFKLAMMVSQLPGSDHSRAVMGRQIEAWIQRNDWSEMSDAVRALYSILAGNMCSVEGKGGATEDRAEGFSISERFGLSWKQAFALRLQFGGYHSATDAVQAYGSELTDGLEPVIPSMHWNGGTETEDAIIEVLMVLAGSADLSKVFDPTITSGSAFDTRLTWQLAAIFNDIGRCHIPAEALDRLTMNLATEVEASGRLISAVWVLLHLHARGARQKAIVALLERNAKTITHGDDTLDSDAMFTALNTDHGIPGPLIWRARALYAASHGDAAQQASCLLHAGDAEEAHHLVFTNVGPQAVIEQDFDALAELLEQFGHHRPGEWHRGGQVYIDFVRLVRGQKKERNVQALLQKVRRGLAGMEKTDGRVRGLPERVAVIEMARTVADVAREHGEGTEDVRMSGFGEENRVGDRGADMWGQFQRAMGVVV